MYFNVQQNVINNTYKKEIQNEWSDLNCQEENIIQRFEPLLTNL